MIYKVFLFYESCAVFTFSAAFAVKHDVVNIILLEPGRSLSFG